MTDLETDHLDEHELQENDLVLLAVPGQDAPRLIPTTVASRIETPFIYDAIGEGQLSTAIAGASSGGDGISNLVYQAPAKLGSNKISGSPTDVFDISADPGLLYEMFLGISPAKLRVLLQQPFNTNQRGLPTIGYTGAYFQQGWLSGVLSPFYRPSHKARIMVLPGLSIATGYANPDPDPAPPVLMFWINACRIGVVNDPQLAWEMLTRTGRGTRTRVRTVGGIQPFSYNPAKYYGISGFLATATEAEVAKGVTPVA